MSNIGYEDPSLNNANSLLNTDIPVFDNAVPTILSINTGSQSNSDILGSVESANLVPDATPGSGSLFPSDPAELPQINSLFELLQYLSEVMIRFNSNPKYYMQDDFAILIKFLLLFSFKYLLIRAHVMSILFSHSYFFSKCSG